LDRISRKNRKLDLDLLGMADLVVADELVPVNGSAR